MVEVPELLPRPLLPPPQTSQPRRPARLRSRPATKPHSTKPKPQRTPMTAKRMSWRSTTPSSRWTRTTRRPGQLRVSYSLLFEQRLMALCGLLLTLNLAQTLLVRPSLLRSDSAFG